MTYVLNLIDATIQARLLLVNLKDIIEKLQAERNCFKNQVEKLKIEKKQLISSNKILSNKVNLLQIDLQRKALL